MPRKKWTAFSIASLPLLLCAALMFAQNSPPSQKTKPATAGPKDAQVQAEQLFNANCSRCHHFPSSIPPRITGTVIMHMRVRARLSRRDEELLLKYLAP